jgi:hypothetical protein
VAVSARVA